MLKDSKNIKVVIFDLDDTLYDCSGTLVLRGRRQVARTIARLIKCSEEEAYNLQLETEQRYGVKTNIYEKIVTLFNLPTGYAGKLLEEFIRVDIANISPFSDVIDTLVKLKNLGYKLILVTSGDKEIQRNKIDVLGLNNSYFDEMFITDRDNGCTKKACFKEIVQRHKVKSSEIVCVGDKIDDELTAGKSLGMITVLLEHGRHYRAYQQEHNKGMKPDYFIKRIDDLLRLDFE